MAASKFANCKDDSQRIVVLCEVMESMEERLFGNGQPGVIEKIETRVHKLEAWVWRVAGALTLGRCCNHAVKALVGVKSKMSIKSAFKSLGHKLVALFSGDHSAAIHTALNVAREDLTIAQQAFKAVHEAGAFSASSFKGVDTILTKIGEGVGRISDALNSGAAVHSITDYVNDIATLADNLVTSGDVFIKNDGTKGQYLRVVSIVHALVGTIAATVEGAQQGSNSAPPVIASPAQVPVSPPPSAPAVPAQPQV